MGWLTGYKNQVTESYNTSKNKCWWVTKPAAAVAAVIGIPYLTYRAGVTAGLNSEPTQSTPLECPTLPQVVTSGAGKVDSATLGWCGDKLAGAEDIQRMLGDKRLTGEELALLTNVRTDGDYSPTKKLCDAARSDANDLAAAEY